MKKFFVSSVTLSFLIASSILLPVAAKADPPVNQSSILEDVHLREISNLEIVSEVPDGIVPKEFDSMEEALAYLEGNEHNVPEALDAPESSFHLTEAPPSLKQTRSTGYFNQSKHVGSGIYIALSANTYNRFFSSVNSIYPYVGLGINASISNANTYASIIDRARTISVNYNFLFNYYVSISGQQFQQNTYHYGTVYFYAW